MNETEVDREEPGSSGPFSGSNEGLPVGPLESLPGSLEQLSVGCAEVVWGIDKDGRALYWDRPLFQVDPQAPELKEISVGSDGTVWAIDTSNKIRRKEGNTWVEVPGWVVGVIPGQVQVVQLSHISVGAKDHVWGIDEIGNLYRWVFTRFSRIYLPRLTSISVGSDGTVWGIDAANKVIKLGGNTGVQIPGLAHGHLEHIAVGAEDHVWGIDENNNVHQWNGNEFQEVPGLQLKQISVGSDGTVWGIDTSGRVQVVNNWYYHQIIPVAKFAKTHSLPDCEALPDNMKDPYAGIGEKVDVELAFHDIFGNRAAIPEILQFPLGYTDAIIGVTQWPGVMSSYCFRTVDSSPALIVDLSLQASNYIPLSGNKYENALYGASTHLERFKQIYYQLCQEDVTISLATSVRLKTTSPYEYEYMAVEKGPLTAFVNSCYLFLNAVLQLRQVTYSTQKGDTLSSVAFLYNISVAELALENKDRKTSDIFQEAIDIPLYYSTRAGDTLQSIVDRFTSAEGGTKAVEKEKVVDYNRDKPLNPMTVIARPDHTITATSDSLHVTARKNLCTVANIACSNKDGKNILREGTKFIVDNICVVVGVTESGTDSFEDLKKKFEDGGVTTNACEIAIANEMVPNIFSDNVTLRVTDYIIQEGDTFDRLITDYNWTLESLAEKAFGCPNVFPSGTPLFLGRRRTYTPSDETLSSLAEDWSISVEQLVAHYEENGNDENLLVTGTELGIPNLLSIQQPDQCYAPYIAPADIALQDIANTFGVELKILKDLNKNLFNPDAPVSKGALVVCPLPSADEQMTLETLAQRYNTDPGLIAQANASLQGFLAENKLVTVKELSLKTVENETFNTLVARFLEEGIETTPAEIAGLNKYVEGLVEKKQSFILPPKPVIFSTKLDPKNLLHSGAIFQLNTYFVISRKKELVSSDFDDVEEVWRKSSLMSPKSSVESSSDSLSLRNFALNFESAFPGFKTAVGRSESGIEGEKGGHIWVVDFSETGISKVSVKSENASYFALKPLSTKLEDRECVEIQDYDSSTGKLKEEEVRIVNYKAVDMEVWARDFLNAVELFLSPEYVMSAHTLNKDAVEKVVGAKLKLAENISQGLDYILDIPYANQNKNNRQLAQEIMKQHLRINLFDAYATDVVIQYPVEVESPYKENYTIQTAPRLSGKPISNIHKIKEGENLKTIARKYEVSALYVAKLLSRMRGILNTNVEATYNNKSCSIDEYTTIGILAQELGSRLDFENYKSYKDYKALKNFVDGLGWTNQVKEGLFAVDISLNIVGIIRKVIKSDTFETLQNYFNCDLDDIVLANHEKENIFSEGKDITYGEQRRKVTSNNNSLAKLAEEFQCSPVELVQELRTTRGILNPDFEASLVLSTPVYTISSGKTSLLEGSSVLNFLVDIKSEAEHKKAFLDLNYIINELEYDIETVEDTEGYQSSSWLSFIIPIEESEPSVIDSFLGPAEVPIPLRRYPEPIVLVSQSGTPTEERPSTVDEAKRWDYTFTYSHESAAQDTIYLDVVFNVSEQESLWKWGKSDLFCRLAQFFEVYPQIKTKLTDLLDVDLDAGNAVLKDAITTFSTLVDKVACAWAYDVSNYALKSVDYSPQSQEFTYRIEITTTEDEDGTSYLDTVEFHLESSGLTPIFPDISCIDNQKNEISFAKDSESDTLCVYKYGYPDKKIPVSTPLQYRLKFGKLNIMKIQNATGGAYVTRNENLVSTCKTAPYFVYTTPRTVFADVLTPFISHHNLISFGEGTEDLEKALNVLFEDLLGSDKGHTMEVAVQYGYELVSPSREKEEPIISLFPVCYISPFTYDDAGFPSELRKSIDQWEKGKPLSEVGGRYILEITVFSSLTGSSLRPLLQLKKLGYLLGILQAS
jgi:hypothetical protein